MGWLNFWHSSDQPCSTECCFRAQSLFVQLVISSTNSALMSIQLFFSRGLNCHCCPVVGGSFSLWSTGALDVFLMAVLVRVERVSGPSRP